MMRFGSAVSGGGAAIFAARAPYAGRPVTGLTSDAALGRAFPVRWRPIRAS